MVSLFRRKRIINPVRIFTLLALLLTVLLLSVACKCSKPTESRSKPRASKSEKELEEKPLVIPSIKEPMPKANKMVLVVIDTLRADRLGCYGYKDQPTTPAIDRIARDSILFDKFYAASAWTAPSFGTMFTGVSPKVHRNGKWLLEPEAESRSAGEVLLNPLSRAVSTIGELFDDFETGAFVSNGFLHPKFGYARGFDHYNHAVGKLFNCRRAKTTTKLAISGSRKTRIEKISSWWCTTWIPTPHTSLCRNTKECLRPAQPRPIW